MKTSKTSLVKKPAKTQKKVTEAERNKMDTEIELKDIETVIGKLKRNKAPGVTGFTNVLKKNSAKT